MANLRAFMALDMSAPFYFYYTDLGSVISLSNNLIILRDPSGNRQEYRGRFSYTQNSLNWRQSTLSGFDQYVGNTTRAFSARGFSISGLTYYSYASSGDERGLIEYVLRGNDVINGSEQSDILNGGMGNDRLNGSSGDDVLTGGAGRDVLTGGAGVDQFRYADLSESGVGSLRRDTITDFNGILGERIDLSTIDAFTVATDNQAFTYIGAGAFTGSRGEVRFSRGILQINTGTDQTADMEIALTGVTTFSADYLVL